MNCQSLVSISILIEIYHVDFRSRNVSSFFPGWLPPNYETCCSVPHEQRCVQRQITSDQSCANNMNTLMERCTGRFCNCLSQHYGHRKPRQLMSIVCLSRQCGHRKPGQLRSIVCRQVYCWSTGSYYYAWAECVTCYCCFRITAGGWRRILLRLPIDGSFLYQSPPCVKTWLLISHQINTIPDDSVAQKCHYSTGKMAHSLVSFNSKNQCAIPKYLSNRCD